MSVENKILSYVLDSGNIQELKKYNVDGADFKLQGNTYDFIIKYVEEFGELPSYTEVVAECEAFDYEADVTDNLGYLCKKLKNDNAKREAFDILQNKDSKQFDQLNGNDFVDWLLAEANKIKRNNSYISNDFIDYGANGMDRLEMYEASKENRTNQYIPTPYPTLTKWLDGGLELGDYVLMQAYTNRGKTWLASQFGLEAYNNGFSVLHYSPELTKKQVQQRLDTLNGHFNNTDLRTGELVNESQYKNYLSKFDGSNGVNYIIRTMSELKGGLDIKTIEQDLKIHEGVKMVIIDGFNLMRHSYGDSNRNKMANTSRQLRQLFGRHGVVGLVVHQVPTSAEKENKIIDEAGSRVVNPPKLTDYSETIACIQDASTVLNFDQCDGVGKILLAKSRASVVDRILDLHVNFNDGFIREVSDIDFI